MITMSTIIGATNIKLPVKSVTVILQSMLCDPHQDNVTKSAMCFITILYCVPREIFSHIYNVHNVNIPILPNSAHRKNL